MSTRGHDAGDSLDRPQARSVTFERRGFLQSAGAGAAVFAASVAGCDRLSTDPTRGENTDQEAPDPDAKEAPMLAKLVAAGELPPVAERLPATPMVVQPTDRAGVYGGGWRTVLTGPAEAPAATVGYENLMRWNPDFTEPIPNIAEAIDVADDGREYVIHLRSGMKWWDGHPYTADDVVFGYNDIIGNEELQPVPEWLTVDGEPGDMEKLDELTIRILFPGPNGLFLYNLATPFGGVLSGRPRHYLEQFHQDYNPDVEQLTKDEGYASWMELFWAKADVWENPECPTVHAWRVKTPLAEGQRLVLERNPYYWKVDPDGHQLPYIDEVSYEVIADVEVIVLKVTNGELDMVDRYVNTEENKPVLARGRETGGYDFFDLVPSQMNRTMISLNLAHKDPSLREIFQNRDFRIGLSYAINRDELIAVVHQRQGESWQGAPRRESDFFDEEFAKQYTDYDPKLANEHLDRAGYSERDGEGFRLRPDGERIGFSVEIATGTPHSTWITDSLELVRDYWRQVGVEIQIKAEERSLFYKRKAANEHDVAVWQGAAGLTIDAMLDPRWYFPFSSESNYAIPWANWFTGAAEPTEEPPESTQRQMALYRDLRREIDPVVRGDIFRQILQIAKEEFYAIGTALPAEDYGIVKNNFHNVPNSMFSAWMYPNPGPTNPEQYFIED